MPPFKDDEVYKALNGTEQMKGTRPQWDLCSSKHIGGWLVHRFPQKKIKEALGLGDARPQYVPWTTNCGWEK